MNNPTLTKSLTAGAAIAAYRIVKPSALVPGAIAQAAGAAEYSIGVAGSIAAAANGDRIEVILAGAAEVEYGGNVGTGDLLTSDADGKAVAAAPAAGVNSRIIGVAMVDGVAGDIGSVLISPSSMQGA